ncbi:hypothetical protein QTO34_018435, partial [Cnephaeus nilssonii]
MCTLLWAMCTLSSLLFEALQYTQRATHKLVRDALPVPTADPVHPFQPRDSGRYTVILSTPTAVEVDGIQTWLHHSQLLHQETAWILATTREIPSLGSTQARRKLDTCRRGTGLHCRQGPQLALIARLRPSGQGRKPLAEAWALGRDPQLARITCKGPQLAPLEGSTPSQGLKPLAEAWALGRDPQLAPITCRDPELAPLGPPDGSIPRSIQGQGLKLLFEAWALVRDPQLAPITAGDPSWFQWPSSTPSQCRKPLAEARALDRDPQLALITCGGPLLALIFPSDLRLQYPSSNNCSPRLQPSWL